MCAPGGEAVDADPRNQGEIERYRHQRGLWGFGFRRLFGRSFRGRAHRDEPAKAENAYEQGRGLGNAVRAQEGHWDEVTAVRLRFQSFFA